MTVTNDDSRQLMPDVAKVIEMIASLGMPTIESMPPAQTRAMMEVASTQRPPGPAVGEIVDGNYPGASGSLAYRLYRPATPGAHPIALYFHGGGWTIGNQKSDDPLCRDLCVRSGSIIVSVDYRHGPEYRFPAAHDDAFAALQWVSQNARILGGVAGGVVVVGWSAGANLAASVSQRARDAGGPRVLGQVLLTLPADFNFSTRSHQQNADGYMLTTALVRWFSDNYVDVAERTDPRVAILRGNLSGLPPALILTADFDPLRDDGKAYADALAAAGNDVVYQCAEGQVHSSITMVDVIASGVPYRVEMAKAIQQFGARV